MGRGLGEEGTGSGGENNGRERGGGRCYGKELGCGEGKRIENGSAWQKSKSGVLDCFR